MISEVAFVLKFPFKVELFAAKDLVGSKLKVKPNPYALITCGNDKRFRFVHLVFPFLYLIFSLQEVVEPRKQMHILLYFEEFSFGGGDSFRMEAEHPSPSPHL